MRVPRLAFVAVVGALACGVCIAHQDRLITITADGTLIGIPTEYGPAQLKVAFSLSPPGEPRVSLLSMHLGKKQTDLPQCVTELINSGSLNDIHASASWYHIEHKDLPYYLAVTFYDARSISPDKRPGYRLLFNLRTAELFELSALTVHAGGEQQVPLDLDARRSHRHGDLDPVVSARGLTTRSSGP